MLRKLFLKAKKVKLNKRAILLIEVVVLIFTIFLINQVNISNRKDVWEFNRRDIHYEYRQALEFGKGRNPYERILEHDLLVNRKYATLLPFYYYFLFFVAKLSHFNFEVFIDNYRQLQYVLEIGMGLVIYLFFRRENKYFLGCVAGTFAMFNRWMIRNIMDGKQDVISIFFLLVSLYLLTSKDKKKMIWSFLFYGISMGIKHIGVFLGPIYLFTLIKGDLDIKDFAKGVGLFLIPTLGASLYLIFDNMAAFFFSMLFSFTREPSKLPSANSGYNNLLVLYNVGVEKNNIIYYLLPRLPLVLFTVFNTLLLWLRKLPIYVYCLTSVFIFIAFNPVLFTQYFVWVVPFIFMPTLLTGNE